MQKTLFVVDDSDANLTKTKQVLEGQYRVFPLPSAMKMFALLEKIIPDMIVLDIEMPNMSGPEAVAKLKANPAWENIPFVFMTGWDEDLIMSHCLELGALDVIRKPLSDPVLIKRMANYLGTDALVKRAEYLDRIQKGIASVLPDIIESRDVKSVGHVDRVAEYTKLMLAALLERGVYVDELRKWDPDTVLVAARFHDVGKIVVPEAILNKANPTMEEYAVLWTHASAGERIIDALIAKTGENDLWRHAKRFAGCHHENWNGSGYPGALKGEQIALEGRILAVVDMYDELRFGRQPGVDHNRAVELVRRDAAVRYDPNIISVFLQIQNDIARITGEKKEEGTADALDIAKNLLRMGMSLENVAAATGLSRKVMESLRGAAAE
ncbi:MAG: response regulator [Deltaproteobacteria bacterium]|jgi:putative two-component system response regulator|nr:response regulator [Deltaproteobacteria bacterium]